MEALGAYQVSSLFVKALWKYFLWEKDQDDICLTWTRGKHVRSNPPRKKHGTTENWQSSPKISTFVAEVEGSGEGSVWLQWPHYTRERNRDKSQMAVQCPCSEDLDARLAEWGHFTLCRWNQSLDLSIFTEGPSAQCLMCHNIFCCYLVCSP